MDRPGGAARPLADVREAMGARGMTVSGDDGRPTRATCARLLALFSTVEDPRQAGKVRHPLNELLLLAFCAVLCGCDTWVEMEDFGRDRLRWLRRFSPYAAGVPSHDTLMRVFGLLDVEGLQRLLVTFVASNLYRVRESLGLPQPRPHLAVDGKAERGTGRRYLHSAGGEVRDVQTLHVWDAHSYVCLHSEAIEEKTNEIPVARAWLADPSNAALLEGAVVSGDAMHAQVETAGTVRSRGADYVFGLKANQGTLREAAEDYFLPAQLDRMRRSGEGYLRVAEKAHGQLEVRETFRLAPVAGEFPRWDGLASLVCQVKTLRATAPGSAERVETRYYVSSLADVAEIADAVRRHWVCESGHWLLDAAFRQDECQDCDRNRFENRAMLNKLALSLAKLMQATPAYSRASVARIRKMLARDPETHFEGLLSIVDRDAFEATVEGLRLTDADRRRYERVLEEAEEGVW